MATTATLSSHSHVHPHSLGQTASTASASAAAAAVVAAAAASASATATASISNNNNMNNNIDPVAGLGFKHRYIPPTDYLPVLPSSFFTSLPKSKTTNSGTLAPVFQHAQAQQSIRRDHNFSKGYTMAQRPTFTSYHHPGASAVQRYRSALSERPHSIDELAEIAKLALLPDAEFDDDLVLGLEFSEVYLKEAILDHELGDVEMAFVNYARTVTMVSNKIPSHPMFMKLKESHRVRCAARGDKCLAQMDLLKPLIVERYESWRIENPHYPLPLASSHSALPTTLDLQRILNIMQRRDDEEYEEREESYEVKMRKQRVERLMMQKRRERRSAVSAALGNLSAGLGYGGGGGGGGGSPSPPKKTKDGKMPSPKKYLAGQQQQQQSPQNAVHHQQQQQAQAQAQAHVQAPAQVQAPTQAQAYKASPSHSAYSSTATTSGSGHSRSQSEDYQTQLREREKEREREQREQRLREEVARHRLELERQETRRREEAEAAAAAAAAKRKAEEEEAAAAAVVAAAAIRRKAEEEREAFIAAEQLRREQERRRSEEIVLKKKAEEEAAASRRRAEEERRLEETRRRAEEEKRLEEARRRAAVEEEVRRRKEEDKRLKEEAVAVAAAAEEERRRKELEARMIEEARRRQQEEAAAIAAAGARKRAEEDAAAAAAATAAAEAKRKAAEEEAEILRKQERQQEALRRRAEEIQEAKRKEMSREQREQEANSGRVVVAHRSSHSLSQSQSSSQSQSQSQSSSQSQSQSRSSSQSQTQSSSSSRSPSYSSDLTQYTRHDGLPVLPLESPTKVVPSDSALRTQPKQPTPQVAAVSRSSGSGKGHSAAHFAPITTTSPAPKERPGHGYYGYCTYPSLTLRDTMSDHQRQQGYTPSLQSMFSPPLPAPSTGLLFAANHPEGPSSKNIPQSPDRPPAHVRHLWAMQSGEEMPARRPSPSSRIIFTDQLQKDEMEGLLGPELRIVRVPLLVIDKFLTVAAVNTAKRRETCGMLMGRYETRYNGVESKGFVVNTLLIPRQSGTSDLCIMLDEELVVEFAEKRGLIALGWIHTHPTQSCFMSSLDLHTHAAFQASLREFFAIVCSPSYHVPNCGVFRLTEVGLSTLKSCRDGNAFHPHPENIPMYTDADKGHVLWVNEPRLEIIDLR